MGVKKAGERYSCNICRNKVTATKAGRDTMVCCAHEMELLRH